MTNDTETYQERFEARKAALEALGYEGPYPLGGMDIGSLFGMPSEYAICGACGSMVALGHPMEREGKTPIERAIYLHQEWHAERGVTP